MAGEFLANNAKRILAECANAARACGRESNEVRLIAVTKGVRAEMIRGALESGLRSFGESYVQEWREKAEALAKESFDWHFIGALQTNKAKAVVGRVALIHSLDRDSLALTLDRLARQAGIRQKVLIEVNFASEAGKSGLPPHEVEGRLKEWSRLENIELCGLMTMPPFDLNPENSRPFFRRAKECLKQWRSCLSGEHSWNELSMGTSQDYKVAISEGSTMVRIGTALFGPREKI